MPEILSRSVRLAGEYFTIAGVTYLVFEMDSTTAIQWCQGTTIPANGTAGFAVGCNFTKTNGTTAGTTWINEGTVQSCAFHLSPNTANVQSAVATIATTSNTDFYITAPVTGNLASLFLSPHDALAASDTNYITFTATNLGQTGAGSTAMLGTNTTKATGGTAIGTDSVYKLTLTATAANLACTQGDRIRIRCAATGTLANSVTLAFFLALFY